ncbi:MAG TPA: corrinoid protein [Verrucomicrobiae bacterium]|nr:corrinoid protein [Verrucomicrobiae bacterium]
MNPTLQAITEAIKKGDRKTAVAQTQNAIGEQLPAADILAALVGGMDDVGRRFKNNEIYVPEVLIAARAMKESMVLLKPILVKAGVAPAHTALIGTVQGDLHDIGKNLVAMMWTGANFNVIDLGTDVPAEKFIAAAKEHNPDLVGLSALLTTTMPAMRTTVKALRDAGFQKLKVAVGGAPVTQSFAEEIGADGFSPDAGSAVDLARKLVAA